MKGTIEIKADGAEIQCHVRMSGQSNFDKLMLMEALATALRFDPLDKKMLGVVFAAGGTEAILGTEIDKTLVDLTALKKKQKDLTSEE